MALYVDFKQEDMIPDEANKVTTGFFEGGVGTIAAGGMATSSLSTTLSNQICFKSESFIKCQSSDVGRICKSSNGTSF